jgi:hypothetical protein
VSLIKQTSLGSIDSIVLENEVFQKDPIGESTSTVEITEEEKKEEVNYITINIYISNLR